MTNRFEQGWTYQGLTFFLRQRKTVSGNISIMSYKFWFCVSAWVLQLLGESITEKVLQSSCHWRFLILLPKKQGKLRMMNSWRPVPAPPQWGKAVFQRLGLKDQKDYLCFCGFVFQMGQFLPNFSPNFSLSFRALVCLIHILSWFHLLWTKFLPCILWMTVWHL